jgi:hypothetical protein
MQIRLKWLPIDLDISILMNMYQLISECTLMQLRGMVILVTSKKSAQDAHRQFT